MPEQPITAAELDALRAAAEKLDTFRGQWASGSAKLALDEYSTLARNLAPRLATEVEHLRHMGNLDASGWAAAHTHAQEVAKRCGIDAQGDRNGVPGIEDIVDMLGAEVERLNTANELLRVERNLYQAENERQRADLATIFGAASHVGAGTNVNEVCHRIISRHDELCDLREERDGLLIEVAQLATELADTQGALTIANEHFVAYATGTPLKDGTWPHLVICSGSNRFQAGTPGHGCCCDRPRKSALVEAKRLRAVLEQAKAAITELI